MPADAPPPRDPPAPDGSGNKIAPGADNANSDARLFERAASLFRQLAEIADVLADNARERAG